MIDKIKLKEMKIVHVNIESPFMDDSGYQETLLAKCHKILCKDVTIINTNHILQEDGRIVRCEPNMYYNKDGVKIIRMDLYDINDKKHIRIHDLYQLLLNEKPDFIMVHGVFSLDVLAIARYIRKNNKHCIVVADSHATKDNANIMKNTFKNCIYRRAIKIMNGYMCYYYKRVYGIVQDAIDLMVQYGGIHQDKTAILSLGYDETMIDYSNQTDIRKEKREQYHIPLDAYLIITGGKLSKEKKVKELVETMMDLPQDVYLLIFGDFCDESYKNDILMKIKNIAERIRIVGNLGQKDIYDVYLAADIAVFPGTPSCLRQQAIATGLPIVVGYNQVDTGINLGNSDTSIFLRKNWDKKDLLNAIMKIKQNRTYEIKTEAYCKTDYRVNSYLYQAKNIIEENR